jgi:hypothetical protein
MAMCAAFKSHGIHIFPVRLRPLARLGTPHLAGGGPSLQDDVLKHLGKGTTRAVRDLLTEHGPVGMKVRRAA